VGVFAINDELEFGIMTRPIARGQANIEAMDDQGLFYSILPLSKKD